MAAPTPPATALNRSQEISSDEEKFDVFTPYKPEENFTSTLSTATRLEESPKQQSADFSFEQLRTFTNQIKKKFNRTVLPFDPNRDRHSDIAPFLFNQVDKTNGSWICFPENDLEVKQMHPPCPFIAICAPLPHHFTEFMKMLHKYGCEILVSLTDPIEDEKVKADVYLPQYESSEINGAYSISCIDESSIPTLENGWVIKRGVHELKLSNEKRSLLLTNFHVSNWKDQTEGTVEGLYAIVKKIYEHCILINNLGPIVVHCSAGVKRSGQVIGCFQIYKKAIKEKKFMSDQEIFTLAVQMRLQRIGLGGDEKQFNMFFKFRDYLKRVN